MKATSVTLTKKKGNNGKNIMTRKVSLVSVKTTDTTGTTRKSKNFFLACALRAT